MYIYDYSFSFWLTLVIPYICHSHKYYFHIDILFKILVSNSTDGIMCAANSQLWEVPSQHIKLSGPLQSSAGFHKCLSLEVKKLSGTQSQTIFVQMEIKLWTLSVLYVLVVIVASPIRGQCEHEGYFYFYKSLITYIHSFGLTRKPMKQFPS